MNSSPRPWSCARPPRGPAASPRTARACPTAPRWQDRAGQPGPGTRRLRQVAGRRHRSWLASVSVRSWRAVTRTDRQFASNSSLPASAGVGASSIPPAVPAPMPCNDVTARRSPHPLGARLNTASTSLQTQKPSSKPQRNHPLTTQPVNAEFRRPAAPACSPPSRSTGVSAAVSAASHRNQKRPHAREPLLQSCARSASQCRSRFLARVIQLTATVMAWSIRLPRGGRMPTWTAKAIAS